MKYTVKNEKTKSIVEIILDKTEWQEAIEAAYQKNKSKFNMQGFRKGKAPKSVIEKAYGKGIFYEDAIDGCFYKYYFEVLQKQPEIKPIDVPQIDIKDMSEDGVTIIAIVENKPEVKIGSYKGLTVEKQSVKISAKEVNAELDKMAKSRVKYVEVSEGTAKMGNIVTIYFSGSVDGKKFDGGTAEDYELELGSKSFIDTFEEQIVGMKIGETKDVNVNFPAEYHAENLKGKPAVFEVKLKTIKEKVVPVIDDKFAEDSSEFATLEELKADIKKKLQERANKEATQKQEQDLIDKIVESSSVEIPEVLIDRQVDDYLHEFEHRLSHQGLKLEDYVKYMGTTIEELKKTKKDDAYKTVKTRLILEKILIDEKIDVTEQEILDKYNESKDKKANFKELSKTLGEEQLAYMENGLLLYKLMTFLKKNNTL